MWIPDCPDMAHDAADHSHRGDALSNGVSPALSASRSRIDRALSWERYDP